MSLKFLSNTYDKESKKLLKMQHLLGSIKNYADNCRPDLMHDAVSQLVRAAQNFALYTRELPDNTTVMDPKAFLNAMYDDIFKIKVEVIAEKWLKITMPPLLPREIGTPRFIREPLNAKLKEFVNDYQREHDGKELFFENGVLIYMHYFNKNRPERQQHDLDNFEKNAVSDSIVFFFLPDDRPKYCAYVELSKPADDDFTEIFLIPQCDLILWLQNYQL